MCQVIVEIDDNMRSVLPAMDMRRRMVVRMNIYVPTGDFVHPFPFLETSRPRGFDGDFPSLHVVILEFEDARYYVLWHCRAPGVLAYD